MMHLAFYLFLLLVVITLGYFLWKKEQSRHHWKAELDDIQGDEQRMFVFLRSLGTLMERDPTHRDLSKIIVDGVCDVMEAQAGAIYFLSKDESFLNPYFVSEQMPLLIPVSAELVQTFDADGKAALNHMRLTRVSGKEGLLASCLSSEENVLLSKSADAFSKGARVLLARLRYAGKNLGVMVITRAEEAPEFGANELAMFRSVAEQSAFAIGNAKVYREANEKRSMEQELRHAREVQHILLPQVDPVLNGYRITGINIPARIISGDYYDYLPLPDGRLGIAIADVSGKGVPAGLLMSMCRSVLRLAAKSQTSPATTLAEVNREIFPDIREDKFITLSYLILNENSGDIEMVRAGHDPALLFRKASGAVELLRSPGMAIGIDAGKVFSRATRDATISLAAGDCLMLYTDGVRECLDENDEEFGFERMQAVFQKSAPNGVSAVIDDMQAAMKAFVKSGPQLDDITMVVIEKIESLPNMAS